MITRYFTYTFVASQVQYKYVWMCFETHFVYHGFHWAFWQQAIEWVIQTDSLWLTQWFHVTMFMCKVGYQRRPDIQQTWHCGFWISTKGTKKRPRGTQGCSWVRTNWSSVYRGILQNLALDELCDLSFKHIHRHLSSACEDFSRLLLFHYKSHSENKSKGGML